MSGEQLLILSCRIYGCGQCRMLQTGRNHSRPSLLLGIQTGLLWFSVGSLSSRGHFRSHTLVFKHPSQKQCLRGQRWCQLNVCSWCKCHWWIVWLHTVEQQGFCLPACVWIFCQLHTFSPISCYRYSPGCINIHKPAGWVAFPRAFPSLITSFFSCPWSIHKPISSKHHIQFHHSLPVKCSAHDSNFLPHHLF